MLAVSVTWSRASRPGAVRAALNCEILACRLAQVALRIHPPCCRPAPRMLLTCHADAVLSRSPHLGCCSSEPVVAPRNTLSAHLRRHGSWRKLFSLRPKVARAKPHLRACLGAAADEHPAWTWGDFHELGLMTWVHRVSQAVEDHALCAAVKQFSESSEGMELRMQACSARHMACIWL